MSSFVAPVLEDEDDEAAVEQTLRPRSLDEFVGQERVKEQLEIALIAAKARGEALDHVLLAGPPGLGKTSLAHIVREELGVGLRTIAGPAVEKKDIAAILTALEPRDVLFVDEIHRMSRTAEEILYPALEDFRIDIVMGEGAGARTLTLDLPPFTLIGATTRTGLLTTPLRDRFGLTFRLDYYDAGELGAIVHRSARILGVEIAADAAEEIARRARGTPRIANRILRRVRDVAEVRHQGSITNDVAREALTLLEIDEQGLDREARELLRTIAEQVRRRAGRASRRSPRRSARSRRRSRTSTSRICCSSASSSARRAAARSRSSAARTSAPRRPRSTSSSERHLDAAVRRPARGLRRAHPPGDRRLRRGARRRRRPRSRSSSPTARASRSSASSPSRAIGMVTLHVRGDDGDVPDALIVPLGSIRRIELRKTPEARVGFGFSVPPARPRRRGRAPFPAYTATSPSPTLATTYANATPTWWMSFEVERLLRERRERRVAADDADDEPDAHPRGQVMPVDERRRDEADQKAAADVDRERRPRDRRRCSSARSGGRRRSAPRLRVRRRGRRRR